MKTIFTKRSPLPREQGQSGRRGTAIILAVVMMFVVLGIAAFTVDYGLLNVTKGQMQNAADSAAHAAMQELIQGIGPGATMNSQVASSNAGNRAETIVQRFRTGDVNSTSLAVDRDVRFGRRSWNSTTNRWVQEWGTTPYNMVEVTVRRTKAVDAPLGAVFSRVFGHDFFDLEAKAVASVAPVTGFSLPTGGSSGSESDYDSTINILPIALDLTTWNSLLAQIYHGTANGFQDQHRFNENSGTVSSGSDGILEVNIYPDANSTLPPGNRGTVDLGSPNNSTNDLKRQIEFGLNAYDLSFFPNNEIKFNSAGTLELNGDTGISAGIESSLKAIIGHVSAIPIFISVSGPGNNAQYTIVKFVGVRVMAVKLTGGPTMRYLRVQPAPYSTRFAIRGNVPVTLDSVFSQPLLIQ